VAATVAAESSVHPRSVKLPWHISIPFVGHVSPNSGFIICFTGDLELNWFGLLALQSMPSQSVLIDISENQTVL